MQKNVQHLDKQDYGFDHEMDRKIRRTGAMEGVPSNPAHEPFPFSEQNVLFKEMVAANAQRKRELLHETLTSQEFKRRKAAVQEQNMFRRMTPPAGGDDPLIQLRQRVLQSNSVVNRFQSVPPGRTAGDDKSGKVLDKLVNDPNQRKLLEKLHNDPSLHKDYRADSRFLFMQKQLAELKGPGVESIKHQIGNIQSQQLGLAKPTPRSPFWKTQLAFNEDPYRKLQGWPSILLGAFDVEAYLSPQRMLKGQGDPMKAFQFNQVVSDATPPDRWLRDVRNPRYALVSDPAGSGNETGYALICKVIWRQIGAWLRAYCLCTEVR